MTKKFFIILFSFLFFLFVPRFFFGEELTILHTNDTHSHIYPFGPNGCYGGIDRMSTMIKELKGRNKNVLALNAGDVFVGTFAFNAYLGYPELKIMEGLYDAMCLGNHEFDLGIDTLTNILNGTIAGGSPVKLPVLCANIDWSKLDKKHRLRNFVKPYIVMDVSRSLRVGLIGVVEITEYDYSPDVLSVLTDPYDAAGYWAGYLKTVKHCNIVICLSHLGKTDDVTGLSNVPGIDIIVGGHSHDALFEPIQAGGKIIVQAGEFGMYLGVLKVDVGKKGGVKLIDYKLHPINSIVKKDPDLRDTLFELKMGIDSKFGPVYDEPIAYALWNLEKNWEEGNPYRDTAVGNLVTDAIRAGVKYSGQTPDIALEANGYIATRIYKGKVVGNDILRVVPYGYDKDTGLDFKIKLIKLSGAQILTGLEFSVYYVEYFDDLAMQASGLTFEYDSSKTAGSRIDLASVKINRVSINPNGLYWVAINEQLVYFLGTIGISPIDEIDPVPALNEYTLVKDYAHKIGLLAYKSEGRIIDTAIAPLSHKK
jgi:5'-nucleotidase/UDP-sugar diphosphatase